MKVETMAYSGMDVAGGGGGPDMQGKDSRDFLQGTLIQHQLRTGPALLCRLEQQLHCALQL